MLGEYAEETYGRDIPDDDVLVDEIIFTDGFNRRMGRLLRNPNSYVKNIKRPIVIKALRTAAIIFLVASILFGTLMTIPAARAFVKRIIQTWQEDHIRYTFAESGTVAGDWIIGYIPGGYNLLELQEVGTETFCIYINENNDFLIIEIFGSDKGVHIDSENYTYDRTVINGVEADIYESTAENFADVVILRFDDKNIIIKISGIVGIGELIQIAENVVPQ